MEAPTTRPAIELVDLPPGGRDLAVPVVIDSFTGVYRWHAKRTLREVPTVRAARLAGELVGVAMLDRLVAEVGYVYYIAVRPVDRGKGIGGALLDDAIGRFGEEGATILYAAVRTENAASLRLFESRGFRAIARKELGYREGGLGAWGLRSRMRLVHGERLLGRRLEAAPSESPGRQRAVK